MENLEIIWSLFVGVCGFLTSTLTYVYKFKKAKKAKCHAEGKITIKEAIIKYIADAEMLFPNGDDKKAYVIERARYIAKENCVPFDEEYTSTKIDELVALSKVVNVNLHD